MLEVLTTEVVQEKKIKEMQIGKEDDKLAMFADKLVLNMINAEHWTRKILYLINAFSKTVGYKINVLKSVAFLYPKDKQIDKETGEAISFTITSKIS